VPLIVVPVAAVYWGATVSLKNTGLVAQLEESLEDLKQANRLKDDFVAVVSHELRTPLTSIQGYVKTLLQLAGDLDLDQQNVVPGGRRPSERAAAASDRAAPRRLPAREPRGAADRDDVLAPRLDAPGRRRTAVDRQRPGVRPPVRGGRPPLETDESKVRQILSNLIENAIKYSPPDSRITIRETLAEDGRVLSVEDEGGGIPDDSRERVFERFYQVDQTSTRRVGGTGLGLYICSKMADSLGARLWLDRSDAQGSVFCLALPARAPDADQERGETSRTTRSSRRSRSSRA
jgi:signal transduction histidine kinase